MSARHRSSEQAVRIPLRAETVLEADLSVPERARGVVVFAHGSGSSRHSPRNRLVASGLQERGLGTLLMDLLTLDEEAVDARTRHLRFDVELLAGRLQHAVEWVSEVEETRDLPIGCFGASTGAAAALVAAGRQPSRVAAVVSRGGRPDLAGEDLERVRAPTLLIVGSSDDVVITLNREALAHLPSLKHLEIVPGATHLFEEPGALAEVTRLAADWFCTHLSGDQVG